MYHVNTLEKVIKFEKEKKLFSRDGISAILLALNGVDHSNLDIADIFLKFD